jgi:ABC-type molybdenum transport system ATPase subunit/photorepair protein PhrA
MQIKQGGMERTILVQGHMGTGKSSILDILAKDLPTHTPCYFDCTTKDLGDITIPNISKMDDGTGFVSYLVNEELGVHHNKPIILMIDEYGKANPSSQAGTTACHAREKDWWLHVTQR